MSKYVKHNQNPFGETTGDCTIRAISHAVDIDYEKVCQMMGKRFVEGKGLVVNVSLKDMLDFSRKYGLMEVVEYDIPFLKYVYWNQEYVPTREWPTLREFADSNRGKYVVIVRRSDVDLSNSYARELFKITLHVVFVDGNKREYYDNMNTDPGDMTVYGIFKVL